MLAPAHEDFIFSLSKRLRIMAGKKGLPWKPYTRDVGVQARQLHTRTQLEVPNGVIGGVTGDYLVAFPLIGGGWRFDIWPKADFKEEFNAIKGGKAGKVLSGEFTALLRHSCDEFESGGPE
jgi:hypothetical protein